MHQKTDYLTFFLLSVPPNGLVVYCGTIVTEEGKEKKVNIDFEPFKPINTSLYLCDNKFHTEVRAIACLHIAFLSYRENWWDRVSYFSITFLKKISPSTPPFLLTTQALTALLSDDSKFGFIVIDGSGALFGTLQGNTREVLHKFTVDLPKKHGTVKRTSQLITLSFVHKHSKENSSSFQAEEGSLLCVLLVWEWRRDTTMWEK